MNKPDKPAEDFPLFPHANGHWAKKIKGKLRYFGKWHQPWQALEKYNRERHYLEAGVEPPDFSVVVIRDSSGIRLGDALNLYLEDAMIRVEAGDMGQRAWKDQKSTAAKILEVIDRDLHVSSLDPTHWMKLYKAFANGCKPTTIANQITRTKVMMNWLKQNGHISQEPTYGKGFAKPGKARIRKAKNESKLRWFNASEVRQLILAADYPMKAMIMLGVNCGFGNGDCAKLESKWIDCQGGWIDFDRPKTGVPRRAKLWPETIEVLSTWQRNRPSVQSPLFFVTKQGNCWSNPHSADCAIAKAFAKLCKDLNCHQPGRGFYGLRRTCETIGGECSDQVAVDFVMGHIDQSMGGVYRQQISDHRLEKVAEAIRSWLIVGPWKQN